VLTKGNPLAIFSAVVPLVRLGRVLAFAASLALFCFAVWYVWTAFMVPIELELREGTTWLLALAERAGVDIYDSEKVAFVNMNHGPMDAMIKGWLATLLPMLAGHALLRIFVMLGPFVMLGAAYFARGRSLTEALLAAGALTLVLSQVAIMMITGRSDSTLLFETVVACALTHGLLVTRHRHWTNGRAVALQVLLGACSAVMFLTAWRIAPTIGTLVLLTLARQVSETNYRFWRTVFIALGLFTLGFALVWLGVFAFELHGDLDLYYKRFFGFFTEQSGWGAVAGPAFELFPADLFNKAHAGVLAITGALAVIALYCLRRERAQLIVWVVILPIGYLAYAVGYWKNHAGGGLHYFASLFVTVWFLIVHGLRGRPLRVGTRPWWPPVAQLAVLSVFAFVYPWTPVAKRGQGMQALRVQSKRFLKDVAARTGNEPVLAENVQLYKRKYTGEVIDCGDVADKVVGTRYFGDGLVRVHDRYLKELEAHPPRYVLAALFTASNVSVGTTKRLNELLRKRYHVALKGPNSFVANGGGSIFLYERND
jgi:hypothetical protein